MVGFVESLPPAHYCQSEKSAQAEKEVDNAGILGYIEYMGTVNLRNMPEVLIRRVKSQAALQGRSMREFVIEALEKALLKSGGSPKEKRGTASRK